MEDTAAIARGKQNVRILYDIMKIQSIFGSLNKVGLDVRKEVEHWWLQAVKDLDSAHKNLNMEEYHLTAFLCQQSVEKALKALYMHRLKESPGTTHSLIFLGQKTGIPKEYHNGLRRLSPDFVITRYPDAAQAVPHELYDEKIAAERIEIARKVIEWVSQELKK